MWFQRGDDKCNRSREHPSSEKDGIENHCGDDSHIRKKRKLNTTGNAFKDRGFGLEEITQNQVKVATV